MTRQFLRTLIGAAAEAGACAGIVWALMVWAIYFGA